MFVSKSRFSGFWSPQVDLVGHPVPQTIRSASAQLLAQGSPGRRRMLQILNVSTQGVIPLFREVESMQNERNATISKKCRISRKR